MYAVWFNMLPSDRRAKWDPRALADGRVRHYWDTDRVLGKWISKNVEGCEHLGPVDWDSYYLFDGDARWDESLAGIEACGTPIVKNTERLKNAVASVFEVAE